MPSYLWLLPILCEGYSYLLNITVTLPLQSQGKDNEVKNTHLCTSQILLFRFHRVQNYHSIHAIELAIS